AGRRPRDRRAGGERVLPGLRRAGARRAADGPPRGGGAAGRPGDRAQRGGQRRHPDARPGRPPRGRRHPPLTPQRVGRLGQLREVPPAEVPVNFLDPRPGTPLADRPLMAAREAIRWIALFRLALPAVILRYAGGREVTLGDLQELGMTAGINALITGNYLTTLGRSPQEDVVMLRGLKMPIGTLSKVI